METIEIRNETNMPILASVCKSKTTGKLYVHIGHVHGLETLVKPKSYEVITVNKVEY